MKNSIFKRVLAVQNKLSLNDTKFYSLVEINSRTFKKIKNEEYISANTIRKIISKTGVDRDWLVEGIGEMKFTEEYSPEQSQNRESNSRVQNLEKKLLKLEEDMFFIKALLKNMTLNQQSSNFNFPTALAGVFPKNFGSSVRVSA